MRARVNPEQCIACGVCVDTCPEVFSLESDVAEAIDGDIPDELVEATKEAAENCPVDAIELSD